MGAYNINESMAWLASLKGWFLGAKNGEVVALPCYQAIVAQARQLAFYETLGVPDSPQGRFELVLLHACLAMRQLSDQPKFTQALFDLMFADFDINLRELGVGDLGVGRRVHGWAAAFRGRAAAYAGALHDTNMMAAALMRNIYATAPAQDAQSHALARYALTANAGLGIQSASSIQAGKIHWPQIPVLQSEAA